MIYDLWFKWRNGHDPTKKGVESSKSQTYTYIGTLQGYFNYNLNRGLNPI